jgi:hypothetical protein
MERRFIFLEIFRKMAGTAIPLLLYMTAIGGSGLGQRGQFIRHHNRVRSTVSDAANMLRVSWDLRLARSAQMQAQKCDFSHSTNSYRQSTSEAPWKWIGENIYLTSKKSPSNAARQAVVHWFSERANYNKVNNTCKSGKECGHYTQVRVN